MRNLAIVFLLFMLSLQLFGRESVRDTVIGKKVYVFDIKEEIAPPIWRLTKLALEEASAMNADFVVIHMNTYGGTLNDADSIRTAIMQFEKPVYVFIDNNAASAGALISIACDSIFMRPGANIGAATVVNQTGEAMPDKYQSYMRSLMRSTAEVNGRDPEIAQAMVDPRLVVEGVIDSTMVLTFTTSEAMANGFCEGEMGSLEEVITHCGGEDITVVHHEVSATEWIIGFLISPVISSLLIMLIVGGIYFELQSPGLGFPIVAALLGAVLYFAPHYLGGMVEHWELIVFGVGIILIALEVFVVPGFGVTGISGLVLTIVGLTLAMVHNFDFEVGGFPWSMFAEALLLVVFSILVGIVGSFFLAKRLLESPTIFGTFALDAVQDSKDGYTVAEVSYSSMIGKRAVSATDLRPSGKVMLDGEYYDALALNSLIRKGSEVEVKNYQNGQLYVDVPLES